MMELPEDLLVALDVYQSEPNGVPPQGSPSLRAMNRMGGEPTKADFEWVERQVELQERASDLWATIYEIAPMPTADDVKAGQAPEFPDWIGTIWQQTMLDPWAQDLEAAIEKAEAYLAGKQAAAAEA